MLDEVFVNGKKYKTGIAQEATSQAVKKETDPRIAYAVIRRASQAGESYVTVNYEQTVGDYYGFTEGENTKFMHKSFPDDNTIYVEFDGEFVPELKPAVGVRMWDSIRYTRLATDVDVEKVLGDNQEATNSAILALLDSRLGKLKVVSAASTMAVDATTFPTSSIVLCHGEVTISSVDNLTYEVVFVVDAGIDFSVPAGIPTMGEADSTKRREFSFLEGALVVGNFE